MSPMKLFLLLILLTLPQAVCAAEDDHLVPEDSIFSEATHEGSRYDKYYENVVSLFRDAYSPGVFGRAFILPSFQNESAIAVSLEEGIYSIHYYSSDTNIYDFEALEEYRRGDVSITDEYGNSLVNEQIASLESSLPSNINDVVINSCKLEIDESLGRNLYTLWSEMLFRTRYADRRPATPDGDQVLIIGADGVTYHYSFDYGVDILAGKIWSPEKSSIAGRFVAITKLMEPACTENDDEALLAIREKTEHLLQDLSLSEY